MSGIARTSERSSRSARVAKIGLSAWFFGNVYEAAVDMPQLLAYARSERPPGVLRPGSPVRYFGSIALPTLVASAITLTREWRTGEDQHRVVARATGIGGAVAISGYLVRAVNLPLLRAGEALPDLERAELRRRWHGLNIIRVALVGAAGALQPSGCAASDVLWRPRKAQGLSDPA